MHYARHLKYIIIPQPGKLLLPCGIIARIRIYDLGELLNSKEAVLHKVLYPKAHNNGAKKLVIQLFTPHTHDHVVSQNHQAHVSK
jgi:hypothetical protein